MDPQREPRILRPERIHVADHHNMVGAEFPVQRPELCPRDALKLFLERRKTVRRPLVDGADRVVVPLLEDQKPLRLQIVGNAADGLIDSEIRILLRHPDRNRVVGLHFLIDQLMILHHRPGVLFHIEGYCQPHAVPFPRDQAGADKKGVACPAVQVRRGIEIILTEQQIRTVSAWPAASLQRFIAELSRQTLIRRDPHIPPCGLIEIDQLPVLRIADDHSLWQVFKCLPANDNSVSRAQAVSV